MHRTKVVCTIGPASRSEERLEQLMRVARLNFSHGRQQEHAEVIKRIRALSANLGCAVAILQDRQGPKIRVGNFLEDKPVTLIDDTWVTITTRAVAGEGQTIPTTYQQLPQDVRPGDRILLDDGLISCVWEKPARQRFAAW